MLKYCVGAWGDVEVKSVEDRTDIFLATKLVYDEMVNAGEIYIKGTDAKDIERLENIVKIVENSFGYTYRLKNQISEEHICLEAVGLRPTNNCNVKALHKYFNKYMTTKGYTLEQIKNTIAYNWGIKF